MKKLYNVGALLGMIVVIGVLTPIYAEDQSLLDQITELEKIIVNKDAIIYEQVQVILGLVENQKGYDGFSKEKYPLTGGFSPDWLKGERALIIETCQEASKMGYELPYCKYV